jgi:hypothetical protein
MKTQSKESFGFRGDNPQFITKICKKYNLSTEGITRIKHVTDLKQLESRFKSRLNETYKGARIKWNTQQKTYVFEAFTNDNLDIFGFTKVQLPKQENGEYGEVVLVPFHLKDPLHKIQQLF